MRHGAVATLRKALKVHTDAHILTLVESKRTFVLHLIERHHMLELVLLLYIHNLVAELVILEAILHL